MTGDGETSHFMQIRTFYYGLRRPALLNDEQEVEKIRETKTSQSFQWTKAPLKPGFH